MRLAQFLKALAVRVLRLFCRAAPNAATRVGLNCGLTSDSFDAFDAVEKKRS